MAPLLSTRKILPKMNCIMFRLVAILAAIKTTATHTVFTTLFINDRTQGDGTCVRMPLTPNNATFPINDLSSNDMACGYDGISGVARICLTNKSDKLSFLFREYADGSQPGALDLSHKGPCAVYMKAVSDPTNNTAFGDGWFKIWDEGYDATSQQWCTEKLIANDGFLSVALPKDLAGGYYLVRPELLSLHQSDKTPPNPQFYVGCAQIFLNSTNTGAPGHTTSIPGYVSIEDASVLFNIYEPDWPYIKPGPLPYAENINHNSHAKKFQPQNLGLLPENAVLINANWWGIELDTYDDELGCWNASQACFRQAASCYNTAPPTGSANCGIWEAKCDGIQAQCNAGQFDGPPNKGADLNPIPEILYTSIPAAASYTESANSSIIMTG